MSVSVIQLTDLHLLADTAQGFKGCNPWRNLNNLLAQIACDGQPDLYLLTGDLSQDHSPELADRVYHQLAERMQQNGVNWEWLPGNHDQPELMTRYKTLAPSVVVGSWRWLLLNTCSGQPHGELAADARDQLLYQLAEPKARFQAVAVHHQPLLVGPERQGMYHSELAAPDQVAGIDNIPLRDEGWLWRTLRGQPQVKAVICGHVHQAQCIERDGLTLFTAPATSVQFTPDINDFAIDDRPPGYRCMTLHDDGSLETEVRRLAWPVS